MYRLPTRAEWEYAAKGGNIDHMVFDYSGSNSLGIYDVSGNVWEGAEFYSWGCYR